jgi:hypothetical protein
MAKFYGAIGYGTTVETADLGVWADNIVEYSYYGDVVRNTRNLQDGEYLNNDLSVGNSISILADAYANTNFMDIRYVSWVGVRWVVTSVDVIAPRLLLRLGGVYNGPTPVET